MPDLSWSRGRRYGLFMHLNVATVPAFAPVHEYADWYWSHLSPTPLADVLLHPAPLPEVIAYHRAHYGDDVAFDDLIPKLTLDRFDADEFVDLAVEAGAGYVVPVTKHHDGFCWWDSALTDRTSVKVGPRRDVIAEIAASCERADLVLGLYYSLLDWSHPAYPEPDAYVERFLHRQVDELVERFRPAILWGDGQWGHSGAHWKSDRLVDAYRHRMSELGLPAAINDRWGASEHDLTTFEYDVPAEIRTEPWELCRGLAHSFCWNRAELPRHHLDGAGIVALLAEVVAKGGNLLLNVGPRADGTIPELQADALREAGAWVRANADVIDGTVPFTTWSERGAFFTASADGRTVNVIDPGRTAVLELGALGRAAGRVVDVGGAAEWRQEDGALIVRPLAATGLATVLRVTIEPERRSTMLQPVAPPASLDDRLATATQGDEVVLEAGRWTASAFPVRIPAGVVLVGVPGAILDGGGLPFGTPVLDLAGDAAGVRDLEIVGVADGIMFLSNAAITATGVRDVVVQGCTIEGGITLTDCDSALVSRTHVRRAGVVISAGRLCAVEHSVIGGLRWGVGVQVDGGEAHRIEATKVHDSLTGVRVTAASHTSIADVDVSARWWGVHVVDADDTALVGNRVRDTMRAFTITAARRTRLSANAAVGCDSGLLLESEAAGTEVTDHTANDCRVGMYLWSHTGSTIVSPQLRGCRDAEIINDEIINDGAPA